MAPTSRTKSGRLYQQIRTIQKPFAAPAANPEKVKAPQGPQISYKQLREQAEKARLSVTALANLESCLLSVHVQANKGQRLTVPGARDDFRAGTLEIALAAVEKYGADSEWSLSAAIGLRRILQGLKLSQPKWLDGKIQRLSDSR